MGGRGARLNRHENLIQNSDDRISGTPYNVRPLPVNLANYSEARKAGMSEAQAQIVISIEEQVRHFSREHVSIVDKAGRMVAQKTGSESKVDLPSFQQRSGLAAIHNHPSGGTFSPADIKANVKNKFERLSVSTRRATYILRHTDHPSLVGFNSSQLAEAYGKMRKSLLYKLKKFVNRVFVHKKETDFVLQQHNNWLRKNASKYNFDYQVELDE